MYYTTEQLIASVKRRTFAPSAQQAVTDSDIIAFANEQINESLVPEIMSVRQDFFLTSQSQDIVAYQPKYTFPERAIGDSLRDIIINQSNTQFRLNRLEVSDIPLNNNLTTTPYGFLVVGSVAKLIPTPVNSLGELVIWYYQRPSDLVLTTACGLVESFVDSSTVVVTVNADLTSSIAVGTKIDIVSGKSPFRAKVIDVPVTAITSSTISFLKSDAENDIGELELSVGDWLCVQKTTPIPQVPQELHMLLAEMVSARVVRALGDMNKLESYLGRIEQMKTQAFKLISNRVEGEPLSFSNRNIAQNWMGFRNWFTR